MSGLNARLLAAHAAGDRRTLVALYQQAAAEAAQADAEGFFLTQAYVFALETGHPDRSALLRRLQDAGRES